MKKLVSSHPDSDISVKYFSSNILIKLMMSSFLNSFRSFLYITKPKTIIELGAGEGFLSRIISESFPNAKITSTDITDKELEPRKKNLSDKKNIQLNLADAKKLKYQNDQFDLVVCSEVLEHIPEPEKALKEIFRVTSKYALLSVPNEPIFHWLNLIRGKYVKTFGNYPDHVNHWSKNSFIKFVASVGFTIVGIKSPFPWTMVLVKKD